MRNLHAIEVKMLSATDTKGTRIKLTSYRFGTSVTLAKDYEYDCSAYQASDYLKTVGIIVFGLSEAKQGWILTTEDFKNIK